MSHLHLGEFLPPAAIVFVYAAAYGARLRTLARQGRRVSRYRVAAFGAGVGVVLLVQIPPLDQLADEVLIAHMIQHLVIGDLASLLIVVGLSGPLLAPLLRLRWFRLLRPLTHPIAAFFLWAFDAYVWRIPFLYQAAIRSDLLHAVEHASYLWTGALLWAALLGPLPKPLWFSNWARLGYVAAVRLTGAVLANVFIWSGTVFYPWYRTRDRGFGLSALSDQNVAGAIMMIEQLILTVLLLGWLFSRFAAQDEERQSLVDLALDRGVVLPPERAARAAAAGTGDHLRARLSEGDRSDVEN